MNALEAARRIFEGDLASTLLSVSSLAREKAKEIAEAIPLEPIVENLGILAAQELADGLEAQGLRAADYVGVEGLSEALAKRLRAYLKDPRLFQETFLTQLAARG